MNCKTIGDSDSDSDGGAIYFEGGNCSVINSHFVDCSANSCGGAIFSRSSNCSVVGVEDVSCKLNSPVDLVAHVVGDSGLVTFMLYLLLFCSFCFCYFSHFFCSCLSRIYFI